MGFLTGLFENLWWSSSLNFCLRDCIRPKHDWFLPNSKQNDTSVQHACRFVELRGFRSNLYILDRNERDVQSKSRCTNLNNVFRTKMTSKTIPDKEVTSASVVLVTVDVCSKDKNINGRP